MGAIARVDPSGERLHAVTSPEIRPTLRRFAIANLILFAILFAITRLMGVQGGLAWESHLGGFLTGLFAMPYLFRPNPDAAPLLSGPEQEA